MAAFLSLVLLRERMTCWLIYRKHFVMMSLFSGLLYFESMVEYKIWLTNHTKAMKTD